MNCDVRPFPFAALPAVTREEARAGRALRLLANEVVNVDAISTELEAIAGAPVKISPGAVRKYSRPRGADDFVGVALGARDANAGIARALLVEVEGAFVASVARKLLKRPPARIPDPTATPSPESVGAFAAIAQAVARRAHAATPAQIVAAGPGATLFADLLRASQEAFTQLFTVVVGVDAYAARVSIARDAIHFAREFPWNRELLASLGETRLALCVVVATASVRAREVMELAPGDVFMPGGDLARRGDDVTLGPVLLIAPRSEIALKAIVTGPQKISFEGEIENVSWSGSWAEASMKEDTGKTEIAVADAPVIVRVEIGAAELTARDWANLKKNDVITLDRKLGDAVSLRVSGIEVARGELIQIDGEVGVRILSKTT